MNRRGFGGLRGKGAAACTAVLRHGRSAGRAEREEGEGRVWLTSGSDPGNVGDTVVERLLVRRKGSQTGQVQQGVHCRGAGRDPLGPPRMNRDLAFTRSS